jgi:ABC-type glycerol-3-phosphate transport system permease component
LTLQADQAVPKSIPTTSAAWETGAIRKRLSGVLLHVVLSLGAVAMILPFVWMVSTSFKELT